MRLSSRIVPVLALLFLPIMSASSSSPSASDPAIELFSKALEAENKGDVAQAETLYTQVLGMDTVLKEYADFFLARLQVNRSDYDDGKKNYLSLLDLSPNYRMQLEAQSRLAEIYLREKNFAKAKAMLIKAEKQSRRESQYPRIVLNLAKAERGLHNTASFCKWTRKLFAKYPDFPEIRTWTLILSQNMIDGTKTGCFAKPDDYRSRIKALVWAGLEDEAKSEIAQIRSNGALNEEEISNLEVFYQLSQGEVTAALEKLVKNYEKNKNQFNYLMSFASVAARAGEMQAAVGAYYRASKIGGHSKKAKEALFQSAFLSYQFQDYDGAYRRFGEFIKTYPTSGLARDAKWHLAWIRYLRGDFQGAYNNLSELKVSKIRRRHRRQVQVVRDDRVLYWMAMSQLRQKKYEEAKSGFESLAKDNLLSYYSIAAQFRLKKLEPILKQQQKLAAAKMIANGGIGTSTTVTDTATVAENEPPIATSEELESEDSLSSTESLAEEIPSPETSAEEVANPEDIAEVKNIEGEGPRTNFSNPLLMRRFDRARLLLKIGLKDWARWDLFDIERHTTNREYLRSLMTEYENVETYDRSSYIGQIYFSQTRAEGTEATTRPLWEHTYPKAFSAYVFKSAKKFDVPFEMVWGIMRAESNYKKDIVSPVGALGLMQVMPSTAGKVYHLMGESGEFRTDQLLQPEWAVSIGAKYLSRLMKKFSNSVPLVAASYNAGPHRVSAWLNAFGDLDIDEFIEHVPYMETRNYVKKVVSNFFIYNHLYGNKKDQIGSLAEPLHVHVTAPLAARENWDE